MKAFMGLLTALVVIGGAYLLLNKQKSGVTSTSQNQNEATAPTNSTATSSSAPGTSNSTVASPVTSVLLAGGSSYSDPKGHYTFLYTNEYVLDDQDPLHLRIYKSGPMERPQGEMTNGVIMVFESIDLKGQSLEELVNSRIAQSTADGTGEIVQPKKATTVNSYPGFTYEIRGLGSNTNILIQKDPQSTFALLITYLVSDPQQKNYQAEVDAVLATVELRK